MEYRPAANGTYVSYLINKYQAPVTAYIAQGTYRLQGKQQPTAWGGDSYSYPDSGTEVPARGETQSNSLPPGAEPLTSGVIAVIYEDGFSEGDENVVQMLLAGRRRTLIDLNQVIARLAGPHDSIAMSQLAVTLRTGDLREAATLDEMVTVPGVKHQYFMTAVPAWLQRDKLPMSETYLRWLQRVQSSKPAL